MSVAHLSYAHSEHCLCFPSFDFWFVCIDIDAVPRPLCCVMRPTPILLVSRVVPQRHCLLSPHPDGQPRDIDYLCIKPLVDARLTKARALDRMQAGI